MTDRRLAWILVAHCLIAGPARQARADQREQVCLNGWWLIHNGGDPGAIPAGGWARVLVPNKQSGWYLEECDMALGVMEGTAAWYRTAFEIPADWSDGRRIALRFEGVNHLARVLVNGRPVGEHRSVYVPFDIDITSVARPGALNDLAVHVADVNMPGMPDDFIDQLKWRYYVLRNGGLIDDVSLRSYPALHLSDVFLMPSVRRARLTARVEITNGTDADRVVEVGGTVFLDAAVALSMSPRNVRVPARATATVELTRPWPGAVHWGYGPYGSPTLYTFRTTLASGRRRDTRFDRFGFREFWCEDDGFRLNGRPIFLAGDCVGIARAFSGVNNRQYVNMALLAARDMNCNVLRLGWEPSRRVWFDVADEAGMMLEVNVHNSVPFPQLDRPINRPNAACVDCVTGAKAERVIEQIRRFVRAHRNHPSVIIWESNNEVACQTDWGADPRALEGLARIAALCRDADPTRPVDHQGSARTTTAAAADAGLDPAIWNVHPYGQPLIDDVTRLAERFGFGHDRPAIMGEAYQHLVLWGAPARTDAERAQAYGPYRALADFWTQTILDAHAHGIDGVQLLSLNTCALIGPVSETAFEMGPWGYGGPRTPLKRAARPGDRADLAVRAEGPDILAVDVTWPADSGEDLKVPALGWGAAAAYGNVNWWDDARKAYGLNVVGQAVRAAYAQVSGGDLSPLAARRRPELIVTVACRGRPVADRAVRVAPAEDLPVAPRAVRTDHAGRAWFVLPLAGRYAVTCRGLATAVVDLEWARRSRRPGYAFVTHCDLVLPDTAPAALARPLNEPDVDRARFRAEVDRLIASRQRAFPPRRPAGSTGVEPRLMPTAPTP